jgi:hypothetical protein
MASLVNIVTVMLGYRRRLGRWPNLIRPRRYTEKMQVAKLTWRDPMMTLLVDKSEVRAHIARVLGPEWVTPSLFVGTALPPREERNWPVPYVIKANHRSRANIFVRKPEDIDWDRTERLVTRWLTTRHGTGRAEWAYQDVPPQVLVEPLMSSRSSVPFDYNFWTFGGKVHFVIIAWDRVPKPGKSKIAAVNVHWERLPFVTTGRPGALELPPRPSAFDRMVAAAETLATGFPAVRVDLYDHEDHPRFGEMTFYCGSGLDKFHPPEYDRIVGDMWPAGPPRRQET